MHREELVGIQTIWWVDYQLAVGFLTGSWKSNLDVWISNHLFGNPTACLSWPRCSGALVSLVRLHCFRLVLPLSWELILCNISLATFLNSDLEGFRSRHCGLLRNPGLWSFKVTKQSRWADLWTLSVNSSFSASSSSDFSLFKA